MSRQKIDWKKQAKEAELKLEDYRNNNQELKNRANKLGEELWKEREAGQRYIKNAAKLCAISNKRAEIVKSLVELQSMIYEYNIERDRHILTKERGWTTHQMNGSEVYSYSAPKDSSNDRNRD